MRMLWLGRGGYKNYLLIDLCLSDFSKRNEMRTVLSVYLPKTSDESARMDLIVLTSLWFCLECIAVYAQASFEKHILTELQPLRFYYLIFQTSPLKTCHAHILCICSKSIMVFLLANGHNDDVSRWPDGRRWRHQWGGLMAWTPLVFIFNPVQCYGKVQACSY